MRYALLAILPFVIILYYAVSKMISIIIKSQIYSIILSIIITFIVGVYAIYLAYFLYFDYSRNAFMKSATGELALDISPLKNDCKKFFTISGELINTITIMNDGNAYCGMFAPNSRSDSKQLIPYKILPRSQAIYWISPTLQVIGPAPYK